MKERGLIITSDNYLLALKEFEGCGIVTIAEFLNRYGLKGIKALIEAKDENVSINQLILYKSASV